MALQITSTTLSHQPAFRTPAKEVRRLSPREGSVHAGRPLAFLSLHLSPELLLLLGDCRSDAEKAVALAGFEAGMRAAEAA